MKGRYKRRISLKAEVLFWNSELSGQGRVLDLTAPGCQIESSQRVMPGQYLELRILLPRRTSPLTVRLAAVRWAKGRRFGAEFIRMAESEQQTLNTLMAGSASH
jgi:hypothetical protein